VDLARGLQFSYSTPTVKIGIHLYHCTASQTKRPLIPGAVQPEPSHCTEWVIALRIKMSKKQEASSFWQLNSLTATRKVLKHFYLLSGRGRTLVSNCRHEIFLDTFRQCVLVEWNNLLLCVYFLFILLFCNVLYMPLILASPRTLTLVMDHLCYLLPTTSSLLSP
jgi:hypothetical protein